MLGRKAKFFVLSGYVVGLLFLVKGLCFAAFSISVQPFGGGFDLRFGRVDSGDRKVVREITLTTTTNIGKQYRVYQRIDQPLKTADGIEIDPGQFNMYTLISSNSKGTLERIEEYPVMFRDTLLYTSNPAGEGDSFKVVYALKPQANQTPGSYSGRIQFIIQPIDSSQNPEFVYLNMYAELSNEGTVEISTSTGSKTLRISSEDVEKTGVQYPSVLISIKGMGAPYRIYQELRERALKSIEGQKFDLTNVLYKVTNAENGEIIKQGDLSELPQKALVYSSDDLGTGKNIVITYEPTKYFPQYKAGIYQGAINYFMESTRRRSGIEATPVDSVGLELRVDKIFRIVAISLTREGKVRREGEGGMLLEFGEIKYKAGPKESKVKIKIESNLGKTYLVTQKLVSPLQNEEGYKIPDELFTFVLSKTDRTKGKLKFEGPAVFESGKDLSLFISNAAGDSDEFDATYELKDVGPDTRAGEYATRLSYSLSEL